MSWTASRWASQQATGSPIAKLLLYALADLADEHGRCWPTQRILCDRTELGRRAVIQHLAGLEEAGLISRERRSDSMGRAAGLYMLNIDSTEKEQTEPEVGAPPAPSDAPHAPTDAGDAHTGAPDAPGLVYVAHTVGAPRAYHNRLTNLPTEPKSRPAGSAPRRKRGEGLAEKLSEEIWNLASSPSRGRSSRSDLLRAVQAALERGGEHEAIRAGAMAYFASPDATKEGGRFAKGVHRVVENDRWASFTPTPPVAPVQPSSDQVWRPRVRGFTTTQFWNSTDWGPKPGKPGCAAPPALLAEFGLVDGVTPIRTGSAA